MISSEKKYLFKFKQLFLKINNLFDKWKIITVIKFLNRKNKTTLKKI